MLVGLCLGSVQPAPGFGPPAELDLSRFRNMRVMFMTAHPDDTEFFAGGTVAALLERGNALNVSVAQFVATTGNAGGDCYNTSTGAYQPESYACEREELAFLRRREMKAGAQKLGVDPSLV